jgi:hypothetical protein
MSSVNGLLVSLLFLVIAAAALARIAGWRSLEELAAKGIVALVLTLLVLPLVTHEVRVAGDAVGSRAVGCDGPARANFGAGELATGALVLLGHVVFGVWWLRRRARQDERTRTRNDLDAARRRSRSRLPPPTDEGPHP